MYKEYMEELMEALYNTKMRLTDGRSCQDYDEVIAAIFSLFSDIKEKQKQVFFIGNGGSAAIASHMTADFMKNGGMKTYSLYDNSVTTCMGNDYGYEHIFSRPLSFLGNEGDLLVAISSSGNSQNIVNAIEVAKEKKMCVLTLSGFKENNRIFTMGDYNLHVPKEQFGMVESIHIMILQQVVDEILKRDGARL
ncbi:D-sedoheptulose 7-phosphate isomerase [Lachnospiraceae bacterium XBB1006]|nr:D-sedoheptulose 7-phosphate isomerase [Lachnospiraceae bacterium XBB1006]